jgi:hypothetical protein
MTTKRALLAVVVLLVAGCSSGASESTKSAPSLESVVRAYTVSYLGGDGKAAYALVSERCKGEMGSTQFERIADQAHALYGRESIVSYKESIKGASATATYKLTDSTLNQTNERWLVERGAWVNDDC